MVVRIGEVRQQLDVVLVLKQDSGWMFWSIDLGPKSEE